MNIRWIVGLSEAERQTLEELISHGVLGARKMKRAQILLLADDEWLNEDIAVAVNGSTSTVYRAKKRCVEGGIYNALDDAPRPGAARKLSGKEEATLVGIACSNPPTGRSKWTMQLLADHLIALTEVEEVSAETVRRRLNEKKIKPWQRKMWCIPRVDSAFVACMEDVLELYAEPADSRYPVVSFDETPIQLIAEARTPIAAAPGRAARVDYEYRRNGTANLFVMVDRHRGWRHVDVTDRRTKIDFAKQMRRLVDEHYPDATMIRVVLDNLSTHHPSALYEAFEPSVARRVLSRLEFHFTPKHASWLNMVEIEIGVLSRQCLDRRISSKERLRDEVGAWQAQRNRERATINWMFDVDTARRKLGRSYPVPATRQTASSEKSAA